MRDCYSALENIGSVVVVGGGARSEFLMQLCANVTGKHILVNNGSEFGAKGAALLAGVGAGYFGTLEDAVSACVRTERSYQPNAAVSSIYHELYALYCHLYQHASEAWSLHHNILSNLPTKEER